LILCINRKVKPPIKNPAIVVARSINVLKPFVNDFLFNPTIIEVDKMPTETRPNKMNSINIVKPIPNKTTANKIRTKNNCIGEKSSVPANWSVFVAVVNVSA